MQKYMLTTTIILNVASNYGCHQKAACPAEPHPRGGPFSPPPYQLISLAKKFKLKCFSMLCKIVSILCQRGMLITQRGVTREGENGKNGMENRREMCVCVCECRWGSNDRRQIKTFNRAANRGKRLLLTVLPWSFDWEIAVNYQTRIFN